MSENSKKKGAGSTAEDISGEEAAKIIEVARQEAEKIIADAKEKAAKIAEDLPSSKEDEEKKKLERQKGEELVEITLFKDSSRYTDDVFVSVNDDNCLIQRGKPVKIKRKFYEVLMNSQAQDVAAAEKSSALSDSFEEKTKKYE